MTDAEKIKKARREYARQYRRDHPDKVRAAQERYWLKRAQKKGERKDGEKA